MTSTTEIAQDYTRVDGGTNLVIIQTSMDTMFLVETTKQMLMALIGTTGMDITIRSRQLRWK